MIQLVKEHFVPVAGDDWYQRRRQDDEGQFFRQLAEQGPRQKSGDGTKQGVYFLTVGGKLLGYKNGDLPPDLMKQGLRQALAVWERLPQSERAAGQIVKSFGNSDERFHPQPPRDATIIDVYTRALVRKPDGSLTALEPRCEEQPHPHLPQRDRLWLNAEEVRSLIPKSPAVGQTIEMPKGIAWRIARCNLTDNTRGEPPFWESGEIETCKMTLTVKAVAEDAIELALDGRVLLKTKREDRGFEATLAGIIAIDRRANRATRFDVVALGEHWGHGTYTPKPRPGRSPLGVAMRLAAKDAPNVPPQGWKSGMYWQADR